MSEEPKREGARAPESGRATHETGIQPGFHSTAETAAAEEKESLAALPEASSHAGHVDTGLACLYLISRHAGRTVDLEQLEHEFGRRGAPLGADDVVRCAKRLRFKAKRIETEWSRLAHLPLPAIVMGRDGVFFILSRVGEDRVMVHEPRGGQPRVLPRDQFEALWSGIVILMARRSQRGRDGGRFDITWFIPAIVRYRRLFGEVLVASFFLQLLALVTPLFFQVVVDKVLVHKGLTTLDVLVIGLVVVSVFEVVLGGLRTYVFSHTSNRIDVELGARLFRHLVALPLNYFHARRVGDSVTRVRELENIRNFLAGNGMTVLIDLFFAIVFLVVMYIYSPVLTYIVIAAIPLYVLISVLVTPVLRRRLDEKFREGAENQAFLVEAVTGIETYKAMAVEPQIQRRWEDRLAAYVTASFRANVMSVVGGQGVHLIQKITMAATLWLGARLVITGDLTIGQLIAFNMLAGRMAEPVLRMSRLWQDFQQVRISLHRLGDILNQKPEPSYDSARASLPRVEGRIEFDQVNFRYRPDGPRVLDDISLVIPSGQTLGVVGPSGSGKSTLARLIQRLYVPQGGRILIDDVDLSTVDPAWLRRQIGVVLQDSVLFNRTLRENIALADPAVDLRRVVNAAKMAGAHDFIAALPEGYDTRIEERGANLSGGQRQRIAIARALISDPRILIFDEATSALDAESEEIIQNNMARIVDGRTVIIIAHRLSALRIADRIITLDRGRIVEDGPHESLMEENGPYAVLCRRQMRMFERV